MPWPWHVQLVGQPGGASTEHSHAMRLASATACRSVQRWMSFGRPGALSAVSMLIAVRFASRFASAPWPRSCPCHTAPSRSRLPAPPPPPPPPQSDPRPPTKDDPLPPQRGRDPPPPPALWGGRPPTPPRSSLRCRIRSTRRGSRHSDKRHYCHGIPTNRRTTAPGRSGRNLMYSRSSEG